MGEEELNAEALEYMRNMLHQNEEFADMTESDKVITLLVVSDAIQYYNEGLHLQFFQHTHGPYNN